MKTVKLKTLSIRNFRGLKKVDANFNDGVTTISGANEMGKSSILEAFMWLLFGKDSLDRKDFEIKHLVNGRSIPKTNVEVEGTFEINGDETILKRQFVENWRTPRGQAEEVYDGNQTVTSFNGAPINVTEYQKRVSEIVDETVFKMVTNPLYFPAMKWELQREQLFQIAGTISDDEIAEKNEKYKLLLNHINGKSFADFKRELTAKKRKAKEQLEQIQPRIDQTVKLMPENQNFPYIESEIERLEKVLVDVDKAVSDRVEAINQQYERANTKQLEVNSLKTERAQLSQKAQEQENGRVYKENAKRRELQAELNDAEDKLLSMLNDMKAIKQREVKYRENHIEISEELKTTREKWIKTNSAEYDGTDNCGSCGQLLPEEQRSKSRENFGVWKSEKLSKIDISGQNLKLTLSNIENDMKEAHNKVVALEPIIAEKETEVEKLRKKLDEMKPAEIQKIEAEKLEGYSELTKQIEILEAEIKEIQNGKSNESKELIDRRTLVTNELAGLRDQLKSRDLIRQYTMEVANLEQEGKELAQLIAQLEGTEFTMKAFSKERIDEVEKRINQMFTNATFRLFEYTKEGNEIETCIPLVKGVPFSVANSAGRINAGLDIIKTLQKHHNVLMPIFIDDADLVNEFPEMENQSIFLKVTTDKKLTIE